jgi:hypothetical protein
MMELLTKYYKIEQIKKNEIDAPSITHWEEKGCIEGLMGKPEG